MADTVPDNLIGGNLRGSGL